MTDHHHVRWMFHSTAMVSDYDLARARLERLAGLRVLELDASHDIERRGGMTWIGDNSIELGQPLGARTAPGRFIEHHGAGMHSIAVRVDDVDHTMAYLERRGVRIAARPRPNFCFSDPRDTYGVFFEWADFAIDADPRSGAPLPPFAEPPLLDVSHHAYVGAIVRDPIAAAHRLCDLLGTDVTFEFASQAADRPWAGVSLGDCSLALFPMPGDTDATTWGRIYNRPRTHLLALAVADLERSLAIASHDGYGVVRRNRSTVILDPAATGGVQIALVDQLLPGDPRRS